MKSSQAFRNLDCNLAQNLLPSIASLPSHFTMTLQAKQLVQQRLMLAPNVTLALEVLRMPTLELRAFLERQLEENPLLELDEVQTNEEDSSAELEPNHTDEQPAELFDEDWGSHWRTATEREECDPKDSWENRVLEQRLIKPQSLYDSLKIQLGCQPISGEIRRIGEWLIHHLDEYGYLDSNTTELAAECSVPIDALEIALKMIQRLEPPGVGARDLRECLRLQLEHAGAVNTLADRILEHHFELFVQHRLAAIAKAASASPAAVAEACDQLRRLNPRPGCAFANDLPPSIIPDLVIRHRDNHYDVELNDQDVPRVAVSRSYYRMLKDTRTPHDAKEFLANKFQKASWLIKAIDERNTTVLSIARCVISLQREFLEHGAQAITPLTQAQVAGLIGRHPSTVSRAICGKTIDTPFGVFALEHLFATGVRQSVDTAGPAISDERIKAEIQRLVAAEVVRRPLSDSALVEHLASDGIRVARRTVAKYRAALKILPAHLRRRL